MRTFTFNQDETTGERTQLMSFAGQTREKTPREVPQGFAEEIFILSGFLETEDGQCFEEGDFACLPAGFLRPALTAREPSEVLHSLLLD